MSLINDMLRNLEARHGRGEHLPPGLVHGGSRPPVATTHHPLRIALRAGLVLLILATMVGGWWSWQHYRAAGMIAAAPAMPRTASTTPVTAPTAPVVPDLPPASTPPKPATTAVARPVPASTDAASQAPIPPASVPATIERSARPPSAQQQAEHEYQRSVAALRTGDSATAETALRAALRLDAAHLLARETLAALLLGGSRLVEAGELLEQGQAYFAQHPTLVLLLARLRLEQGQAGPAINLLEQYLHAATQRADYLALLGALYQREQRYADSVATYRRALELQSQQASWWAGLGIALENTGRREEAIQAYEQAASGSLSPQLRDHVRNRLHALRQLPVPEGAQP